MPLNGIMPTSITLNSEQVAQRSIEVIIGTATLHGITEDVKQMSECESHNVINGVTMTTDTDNIPVSANSNSIDNMVDNGRNGVTTDTGSSTMERDNVQTNE